MAKKRKKKAKETSNQPFIGLISGCGSIGQLEPMADHTTNGYVRGTSVDAVREKIKQWIEYNGADGATFVIAQIMDVGTPNDVQWTGKANIK